MAGGLGAAPGGGCFVRRCVRSGLTRHDTVHAIASVVADIMFKTMTGELDGDPNVAMDTALSSLTKPRWLALGR